MIRPPLLALMLAASTAAAPAQPPWRLTADGLGPVRIGMSQAQVSKALKTRLTGEAVEDENVCVEKEARSLRGVGFMFENGRLTRISIWKPSRTKTQRGITIGATAADVRRAYGRGLKAETNYYEDKPAEYLTYWTAPGKRGIRFETGTDRRVYVIHGGTSSIQYVEGCA